MSIKSNRNKFFSMILGSIFLTSPLQIVNASKPGDKRLNLPREKTTSVGKVGNTNLRRSKAMTFEKTQLSAESTIPESLDNSILKAISEYLDDNTKPDTSKMISDFKKMSFALDNIWMTYLIYSNSNPIKSDKNIKLIDKEMRSKIEKTIDANEKIEAYISKYKRISENNYNYVSSVIKNTSSYVSTLLSWLETLNKMQIISNESLLEIKRESFGTYCT